MQIDDTECRAKFEAQFSRLASLVRRADGEYISSATDDAYTGWKSCWAYKESEKCK